MINFITFQIEKPIALANFPEDDVWTKETEGIKPSNYPSETDSENPSKVNKHDEY